MSRKELKAQLNEFGYQGPTSYSKEQLRVILHELTAPLVPTGDYVDLTGTRAGAEIYGRSTKQVARPVLSQVDVKICRTPRADHYFTVHSVDCKQCPKGGDGWVVHTTSRLGTVADIYEDHVGDRGLDWSTDEQACWDLLEAEYMADVKFHTCLKGLPVKEG